MLLTIVALINLIFQNGRQHRGVEYTASFGAMAVKATLLAWGKFDSKEMRGETVVFPLIYFKWVRSSRRGPGSEADWV